MSHSARRRRSSISCRRWSSADEESRFKQVTTLGVYEHMWHYGCPRKRGQKEQTGMVDPTRAKHGMTRRRLLDLLLDRSRNAYAT